MYTLSAVIIVLSCGCHLSCHKFPQYRYEFHLKDNEAENQFELDLACPRLAMLCWGFSRGERGHFAHASMINLH